MAYFGNDKWKGKEYKKIVKKLFPLLLYTKAPSEADRVEESK